RLEQSLAQGLDQARLADDVRVRDQLGDTVVGGTAEQADAGAVFEARPERTVSCEHERPFAEALEGAREAEDVLALAQRAHAEEGWGCVHMCRPMCTDGPEALEVDAARDDLGLPSGPRPLRLERP